MKTIETNRNLAERLVHAGLGALAGALVATLVYSLEVAPVIGSGITYGLATGLVIGAVIGVLRLEPWLFALSALLILLHFFVAQTPWTRRTVERWIRDDGRQPGSQDAIVILSAYLETDSLLSGDGTERMITGLELYRRGVAPRIVTTKIDFSRDESVPRTSSRDQWRLLSLAGVDSSAWIEVDSVSSTHGEAVGAAKRLFPIGAKRIVLVTTPMHTRRACATFEKAGFSVFCYPSHERREQTHPPLNPGGRLLAFGEYVYERLGMLKYRWKGWVR